MNLKFWTWNWRFWTWLAQIRVLTSNVFELEMELKDAQRKNFELEKELHSTRYMWAKDKNALTGAKASTSRKVDLSEKLLSVIRESIILGASTTRDLIQNENITRKATVLDGRWTVDEGLKLVFREKSIEPNKKDTCIDMYSEIQHYLELNMDISSPIRAVSDKLFKEQNGWRFLDREFLIKGEIASVA